MSLVPFPTFPSFNIWKADGTENHGRVQSLSPSFIRQSSSHLGIDLCGKNTRGSLGSAVEAPSQHSLPHQHLTT
jgi:hypothetical protein